MLFKNVLGLGAFFLLISGICQPCSAGTPERPNFLLIYIDDLGWMDLGCYGSDLYQTPHIDRLAEEGVRFTDAYAACTVCSPSRASLLTGQYPARLHLTDWISGHKPPKDAKLQIPDWQKGLRPEWVTLPELLATRGYRTAWIGKWHVGGHPRDHGFDVSNPAWDRNRTPSQEDPKGVHSLTQEVIGFMDQQRDEPFFVCLSHFAVHTPVRANDAAVTEIESRVSPDMRQQNTKYAAMVHALDQSVGTLMQHLNASGLSESTLVVFYSDNGGLNRHGGKGPTNNAPLREGKGTQYEGGLRVPLIIRWPDQVPADTIREALVTSPDLYPTLANLAGVEDLPEQLDGLDLWPTIVRGAPPDREAIYWHYPHYHQGRPASVIRRGDHKLIEYLEDGRLELFDLKHDLEEKHNLAKSHPDLADELLQDLRAWRIATGAQMMRPVTAD